MLAGVRLAALVAAWWLLGSTLLYAGSRVARLHGAARALGWATLPAVRRWVDRAAAVSIVAASAFGTARPAAADPPPTTTIRGSAPVVIDADHRDRANPPTRTPLSVPPLSLPLPSIAPPPSPPAPAPRPAEPAAVSTHTVLRGEHLWSIAAAHVAAATSRAAGDLGATDITPYWARVVERNRGGLRSGNPSLVYPGEIIDLPPL